MKAALASLGIEAELSGRNDIVSKGVKISGNAQARRSGRIMHHGTLLYSADLSHMSGALNVNDAKLKSKGVKSIRARVGNLKQLYELSLDAGGFKAAIEEYAEKSWPDAVIRPFTGEENAAIQRLADEKYSRWEWNWGQSKQFEDSVTRYFPFGLLRIDYSLSGGYISDIAISGDFSAGRMSGRLRNVCAGCDSQGRTSKRRFPTSPNTSPARLSESLPECCSEIKNKNNVNINRNEFRR